MSSFILAIETSTKTCSVSLFANEVLLGSTDLFIEKSHASHLMVVIDNLLDYSGISRQELNAVAVSSGPGSYTGLRIGTSTAKGLCFALEIPLIGVSTLQALVATYAPLYPTHFLFAPMIDARRMEVYTALFDSQLSPLMPDQALIIDEDFLQNDIPENNIVLLGDGAPKTFDLLSHPNFLKPTQNLPSAIGVGKIAFQKFINRQFENLAYFEPFYLKDYKATKAKKLL